MSKSFGWAAGDVSLAAYIQASLSRLESDKHNVSALGAVMAFLYCTYIVTYAITSPLLGKYIDSVSNANNEQIHGAVRNVGGIQFTIIFVLVMCATIGPKGSWKWNPRMLSGEERDGDVDGEGGYNGEWRGGERGWEDSLKDFQMGSASFYEGEESGDGEGMGEGEGTTVERRRGRAGSDRGEGGAS